MGRLARSCSALSPKARGMPLAELVARIHTLQRNQQSWNSLFAQLFHKFFRRNLDFPVYFVHQWPGEIPARVVGDGRSPTLGMTVEYVASLLAHSLEAQLQEHGFKRFEIDDR